MGNRIFLVATMLAGVALTATSASAAPDAGECLAKPKGAAPAGKHWYYQTNRSLQRKCWYLADEGEKIVAPRKQPAAASTVNLNKEASVQSPAADARAELVDESRAQQPAAEQPAAPVAAPFTLPVAPLQSEASRAASEASPQGASAASEGASPHNWTVASRWPDSSESFAASRTPVISDLAPASQTESPPPALAAEPPQQAPAVVENTGGVNLAPFAAALILAVIVGGALFMFFSSRRPDRRESLADYGTMGDVRYRDEMPWTGATARRSASVAPERSRYRADIDEVEQLLATARQARSS